MAQIDGRSRQVIGAFQVSAPVLKAADLRAREVRTYSVLQHVAESIPLSNRWHPVFTRYLDVIAGRVNAFGTDPTDVHPNPDGTGEPWTPVVEPSDNDGDDRYDGVVVVEPGDVGGKDPGGGRQLDPNGPFGRHGIWIGRVAEIVYDACGCLRGFVLVSCRSERKAFRTTEPGLDELLRAACRDRLQLAVRVKRNHLLSIAIVCC